jgi:hypothetical protein
MKQDQEQIIFRNTNAGKGRTISITPENSSMKHLVYGRIILDKDTSRVNFSTGKMESGLICLSGECVIACDGVTPASTNTIPSICRATVRSKSPPTARLTWSNARPKSKTNIRYKSFVTPTSKRTAHSDSRRADLRIRAP